jgi:NitT/TauT family transport system substrate-binding protein
MVGLVLALTAASCTAQRTNSDNNAGKPVDKVTYLTGFGSFGREGYAQVALVKGYFRDAGMDVTIKPGQAGDFNLKTILAGQAQFAVIDFSGAVVQVGNSTTLSRFKTIAAVQQRSIIAMMAAPGKGIQNPQDLQGKTIGVATGSVPKTLFPVYAKLAGFSSGEVNWVETTPQQLPALLASGQVAAIGQFVVGAPAVKAALKADPVVLPYSRYLTDLYGNAIVTPDKLIANNPDLVKRFRTAILKGLDYSINHPDEAGQIVHAATPAIDANVATAELRLMAPYVQGAAIGGMDESRVARSIAVLQSAGLIPAGFEPSKVVDFGIAPRA